MKKKYPASLFWTGFCLNLIGKFFYLFFLALILMIIGIWVKVCLMIGLALLVLDVILSLAEQLVLRRTTLKSENSNFAEFQEAILSNDWRENVKELVEEKINAASSED